MKVQDTKQTKRFECHLDRAQVVLIIRSFDILVSIKQKCLTITIIEIKYADRTNHLEIAKDTYTLSHEADLLPIK
jgi:hypothetical protein